MSAYIICQERYGDCWAVCVYAVRNCDRIVEGPAEIGGFVECRGQKHDFKMAVFASDSDFLDSVKEVHDWCEEDNWEEEKEAKDGQHAPK